MREGIKYHALSKSEKEQYEEQFGDPSQDDAPDEITSEALNKWLFNTDTVDKVLNHLITNDIKVEGGDKLGKTIIFAKNHAHALFIEERFNKNYPEYAGQFLRVIDNYESKAQDLLEVFVDPYEEQQPQIAVSVDMMDTGVDAPRVVNLVFFKAVKSFTKFWQMIGRGTRLCPDLFGVGQDKAYFAIFDYCQNFEFFDVNPEGLENRHTKGLTQQIFEAKLEIALAIRNNINSDDNQRKLAETYIDECHQFIANLDMDRFVVKAKMRMVAEYSDKVRWLNVSKTDCLEINSHLSPLILPNKDDDERARRFDVLMLNYQLALLLSAKNSNRYVNTIHSQTKALLTKQNIPDVALQVPLLKQLQSESFWETINVNRVDEVRVALRDLMKYLDKEQQINVITHFEDEIGEGVDIENAMPISLKTYKERVESYIREHKDHLVIHKLNTNKPITAFELNSLESILFHDESIGSRDDYLENYGDKPLGTFVREIVGLDANVAQEAFAAFIQSGHLNANQITFINNIISYLTKNGIIDKKMLCEAPFTNLHDQGLFGVFADDEVMQVIKLIDDVNNNAMAA